MMDLNQRHRNLFRSPTNLSMRAWRRTALVQATMPVEVTADQVSLSARQIKSEAQCCRSQHPSRNQLLRPSAKLRVRVARTNTKQREDGRIPKDPVPPTKFATTNGHHRSDYPVNKRHPDPSRPLES
ncbi:hypothetical protein H310_12251 [Aphanomyces invadans]|uniref:Uncharacterized protein n=1 Tax=Aphanomyces invadans TaxID=157072 RepID=A0A024TKS7_9STRA|nr:hypothetical protein H310_12251 [Aphanomyces invadans]ETV93907.1 hypothetical protein H310_12251 [Aphanomyces invadans]|eukprot:XP_008877467.1 hypothetical protein H310_12251 [Aphanomyces invadans]